MSRCQPCHFSLLFSSSATTAASMAIRKPKAIDAAPVWAAAQRRMAAVRLSCLARNGRSPGEESLTAAIAVQAIEAQPAFGQIKPMRGQVLACAEQHFGDVPERLAHTRSPAFPAKE